MEREVSADEGLDHGLSDIDVHNLLEVDGDLHVCLIPLNLQMHLALFYQRLPFPSLRIVVVEHSFEGGLANGVFSFLLALILEVLEGDGEDRVENEVIVIDDDNVEAHGLEAEESAGISIVIHFLLVQFLHLLILDATQRHRLLHLIGLLDCSQSEEVQCVRGSLVDVHLVLVEELLLLELLVQILPILPLQLLLLLVVDEELREPLVTLHELPGHLSQHLEVCVRDLHQCLVCAYLALLVIHQLPHLPLVPQVPCVEVEQVEGCYYLPLPYLLEVLVLQVVHVTQEGTQLK